MRRLRDSNPRILLRTAGFPYHIHFYMNHLQHYLFRCCSLDYFFTILLYNLGATCIVSTPFINITIELSKPSPNYIFLYKRLRFIRVVTPLKFPIMSSIFYTRPVQSTNSAKPPKTPILILSLDWA